MNQESDTTLEKTPLAEDARVSLALVIHLSPYHKSHLKDVLEMHAPPSVLVTKLSMSDEVLESRRVRQLAKEVERLREQLQITTEKSETQQEELKAANIELKDKVEQLSQVNNDLENLMGATEVATLFLDRQLKVKLYTPALEELFDILPLDRGRPVSHLTHQLDYDTLEEKSEQVLRTLIPVEETLKASQGRSYLMRIIPYRTSEDRIEGVILTFVDVTRITRARQRLRQIRTSYELLVDSVDEYAIFSTDKEGRITTWNSGAVRLFGWSAEEMLGESADVISTPEDQREGVPGDELAQAREQGKLRNERWHIRRDGPPFWGSGVMTALRDEDGSLRGFIKVLRDNTDKREAADELRKMNETLEQQVDQRTEQVRRLAAELTIAEQRERQRLSHVLHDDLQQTLYGVQVKLLGVHDHAEAGATDKVIACAEQARVWLDEAITTTRQLSVDLVPPVLEADGLADAASWLKTHMADLHDLHVDVDADQPYRLSDRDMLVLLFHVIRELLFNVVKHADAERATVTISDDGNQVIIRVSDTSVGFEADEPFEETGSGGLGLASIRERVGLFAGHIDVDTEPARGTTVTVRVPLDALDCSHQHD